MKPLAIRRIVSRRPFKPLVLRMNNGDEVSIPSPEIIVTDEFLFTVNVRGEFLWLDNDAITSILRLRGANGAR